MEHLISNMRFKQLHVTDVITEEISKEEAEASTEEMTNDTDPFVFNSCYFPLPTLHKYLQA